MELNKKRAWTLKEQSIFFKRLGYLLQRGYSLSTAIEFLRLHHSKKKKEDLNTILIKLKQGTPFFEVLRTIGFSSDGLSYIFFAVKHGELSSGLLNAGELLEKKLSYKSKLVTVMRYPLFLIFFVLLLSVMMQTILLPQFMSLHESISLPQSRIMTLIVLLQFDLPFLAFAFLVILLFIYIGYQLLFKDKNPIDKQRFLCRIPIVRTVTSKYNTYFLSFHLGTLLASGLSINEALSVFEEQNHLLFFRDESKRIRKFLIEGEQLENILKATSYYEKECSVIIVHGQANGILAKELLDYSQLIIEQLENTFKMWLRILQPAIITFVGLLVILMYMAVMLPLYGMMQTL
jgi:competence protein ComGB